MPEKVPWYFEERSRALALLAFTDDHDVEVRPAPAASPLTLIAECRQDGKPTGRAVGCLLRGTASEPDPDEFRRLVKLPAKAEPSGGFLFPVCGLVFDVKHNVGWWAWVVEPLLAEGGAPNLAPVADATPTRLDREQVAILLARVNRWYDALARMLHTRRTAS